ncbi:MAG: J domain-containing protein [Planctomycetaceae bacterium]|nr:J domain-containing protein [Planctomycetaceae bacterium]
MSTLPDNPDDWPRDPFQLLGITSQAETDDVRRAYTRLVRRYRPDEAPHEFQKIRAAYELANQLIELRSTHGPLSVSAEADGSLRVQTTGPSSEPDADASTDGPQSPQADVDRSFPHSRHDSRNPESPASSASNPLDAAWNLARNGDPDGGRAALLSLRDAAPHDPEPWLRLFWLHVLVPQLDRERNAGDWLLGGLQATALSPRLLDVYCDELRRSPVLVRSDAGDSLLAVDAPRERLFEASRSRWRAAAYVNAWERIDRDLDHLRTRLMIDHPDDWVSQIFAALDHAVWSSQDGAQRLASRCRHELAGFRDRELALSHEYERHAFLLELASDPNMSANEPMRRLIRNSWTSPIADILPDFERLVQEWVAFPAGALQTVTSFAHASPVGFDQLWRVMRQLPVREELRPSQQRVTDLGPLMTQYFSTLSGVDYMAWRSSFLEFCLQEVIWPEEFVEYLSRRPSWMNAGPAAEEIVNDAVLRCIACGGLVFLASMG